MEPEPVANQPVPTISPTPLISPVVPPLKPGNHIIAWFIGGIFILGMGITIGLLFNKSLYPTPQTSPTPTPLPAEASAKEGDPTLNWKTYTSKKYGFLFKFPPEDQVIESADNVSLMNIPFGVEVGDLRTEFARNYLGLPVKSTIKFGDVEWEVLFTEDKGPESGGETTYYQTIRGDFRYVVGYTFSNSDLSKIDQILSTFKFLN